LVVAGSAAAAVGSKGGASHRAWDSARVAAGISTTSLSNEATLKSQLSMEAKVAMDEMEAIDF